MSDGESQQRNGNNKKVKFERGNVEIKMIFFKFEITRKRNN